MAISDLALTFLRPRAGSAPGVEREIEKREQSAVSLLTRIATVNALLCVPMKSRGRLIGDPPRNRDDHRVSAHDRSATNTVVP
jgi:hypothetical protein